ELGLDEVAVVAVSFERAVLDGAAAAEALLEPAEELFLEGRMHDQALDARDAAALAAADERQPERLRLSLLELRRVGAAARRTAAGGAEPGIGRVDGALLHGAIIRLLLSWRREDPDHRRRLRRRRLVRPE